MQISAIMNKHNCGNIGAWTPDDEYMAEAQKLLPSIRKAMKKYKDEETQKTLLEFVSILIYCEMRVSMFPHEIKREDDVMWLDLAREIVELIAAES
jgi:hypothetical protein